MYGVEEAIKNSDVIITGEGSYDRTTKAGKVVQQVCIPKGLVFSIIAAVLYLQYWVEYYNYVIAMVLYL